MSSNSSTVLADDAVAVRGVPQRISAAWADNDADAFAAVFTEDATLILPGDIYLTSREQIRSVMAAGFAGPYRGTRVFGEPLSARFLGAGTAVVVTKGGVLAPGETEVAAERTIRATWVLTKQGSAWLIAAYQNTPVGG
jgi:uncharacterized protein (TIGR02246 family)